MLTFQYPFGKTTVVSIRKITFLLLHVLLPLLTGMATYLFLRPGNTIVEGAIGWTSTHEALSPSSSIGKGICGMLPDFCWLYALLQLQAFIWGGIRKVPRVVLTCLIVLPVLSEFFQYMQWIAGTGDWLDVLAYCIAIIVSYSPKNKREVYEVCKMVAKWRGNAGICLYVLGQLIE